MVTKFLPLPDNNGGHQRSLAIARRLAELGDLVLCGYDDGTADRAGLRDLGIDVRAVPWRVTPAGRGPRGRWRHGASRRGDSGAPRWSRPSAMLPTRKPSTSCRSNISRWCPSCSTVPAKKSILDLHNVESSLVDSYASARSGIPAAFYRAEAVALRRMERQTIGDFDHVVVVSEKERERLPPGPARSWSARTVGSPRQCCPSRTRAHRGLRGHHGMGPQRRCRRLAGPRDLAAGAGPGPRGPAAPRGQGPGAGGARPGRRPHRGDGDRRRRQSVPGAGAGGRGTAAGRRGDPAQDHGGARRRAARRGHVGGL